MTDERPWVKHYQPGVPAEIEIPSTSLVAMFEHSVTEGGDGVALEFFGRGPATGPRRPGRARRRGPAQARRPRGRPRGARPAQLPAARRRVLRGAAARRDRRRAQPALHRARTAPPVRRPRGARSRSPGTWPCPSSRRRDIALDHVVAVNLLRRLPLVKRVALRLPVADAARAPATACTAPAPGTTPVGATLARGGPPLDADASAPRRRRPRRHPVHAAAPPGRSKGAMLTHRNLYANALQGAAWMHGRRGRPRDHLRGPARCSTPSA